MTKRNNLDFLAQKPQWPAWFPYPSCWLKSFVLILFFRVITFPGENLAKFGYNIAKSVISPELLAIFAITAFISPIIIIAFSHHYLHLLLRRFTPEIQAPEVGNVQGLFPKLMSWWEGLYGWAVIVLSTLIATLLCTIILPLFHLSYTKLPENYTAFEQQIIVIFGIIWLVNAALIYQIDYLVSHRLISVYSENKKSSMQ